MARNTPIATALSSLTLTQEHQISKQDVPKMTIGTSDEYIEKTASLVSHAMLPNVIWRLFFSREETDGMSSAVSQGNRLQVYHSVVKQFLLSGIVSGAFIAEAGDFSACASWWPPGSHQPPKDVRGLVENERQGETLSAAFEREIENVKANQIWSRCGQDFWHLGLLARDPRNTAVAGAVRAVLLPFINKAAVESRPIWLATTSEHARDIYLHYGWQVVAQVTIQGHTQWCMIRYPPSQSQAGLAPRHG